MSDLPPDHGERVLKLHLALQACDSEKAFAVVLCSALYRSVLADDEAHAPDYVPRFHEWIDSEREALRQRLSVKKKRRA